MPRARRVAVAVESRPGGAELGYAGQRAFDSGAYACQFRGQPRLHQLFGPKKLLSEFGQAGIAVLLKRAADATRQQGGGRGGFGGGRSSGHSGPPIIGRMKRLSEIDGV